MAAQAPDPRSFTSWEDAFQYPLPVVRKLEQQLRKNIDENRQKLRTLVGASYRDLLGTAGRIIDMDEQMQSVEGHLADIGKKCNARAVERVGENQTRMRIEKGKREHGRYRSLAQTKVLQSTLAVVSRTTQSGGDALLGAKVLVLARLLHKSVLESEDPPEVIEEYGRRLGVVRKKLLGYIERAIVKPGMEKTALAHTLCAYALVSSSSPKDVLRHFLQARLQQIETNSDTTSEASLLQMLRMMKQTLLDSRTVFPKLFAEHLSRLSGIPLLDDPQVRALYELDLDIYGKWLSEDTRAFTPWVRHDQLLASDVDSALTAWARQAHECILQAVKDSLQSASDASVILALRKKVVLQYLELSIGFPEASHVHAVIDVRTAFTDRLGELAVMCGHSLKSASDLLVRPEEPSGSDTVPCLWNIAYGHLDLGDGALHFHQMVVQRRHGRNPILQQIVERLDGWVSALDTFDGLFQQMRTVKWEDELDVNVEDLPDGDSLLETLSKSDPKHLRKTFCQAIREALQQIYSVIAEQSKSSKQTLLLIRLLRETNQRRRTVSAQFQLGTLDIAEGDTIAALHDSLTRSVSEMPLANYAAAARPQAHTSATLWDGTPPLPIQPSPATFKFLVALHRSMADCGDDIWSPSAVLALKAYLNDMLAKQLQWIVAKRRDEEATSMNGQADPEVEGALVENGAVNGEHTEAECSKAEDVIVNGDQYSHNRDRLLQLMFDVLYLQRVMKIPVDHDDVVALSGLVSRISEQLELEDVSSERMKKSAVDYWRRTYLLYGLLASDNL